MGEVIKCEDPCIAYDCTWRTTTVEMLNNQANRMTWPVDVSLYPCNELMNGTIMKAETEAQQHGFPLTKADLATTATENQIWVPWADQKGIVESLVYKSFLILDKVVIHAHRDWQVIWIRICLFCPWDFGLCTIQGLWQCLIHWCGIAPSISLDSRLIWWQRRWGSGHMTMGLLIWPHTIPFRSCQPDRIVEKAFNQAAESLAWVWHPVWVRHYFKMQDTLQTNAIIQAVSIRGKKLWLQEIAMTLIISTAVIMSDLRSLCFLSVQC